MDVDEAPKLSQSLHHDTTTFLAFLNGGVECIMFMKPGSKEVIPGYGTGFYDLSTFAAICSGLWESGAAFEPHVTINLTNLKGRKKSDIVGTRVLCVDIDDPMTAEKYEAILKTLKPHLVVESSPGKYHFYWKCSLSLQDWQLAQGALALKLGGDLNFIDIHKTIRIPGFERVCKDGGTFTPQIVYMAGGAAINEIDDSMRLLGNEAIASRKARDKEIHKKANKVIASHSRTGHVTPQDIKDIGAGERNSSLYQICKGFVIKGNGTVTEESTVAFGLQVNSEFETPLGEDEAIKTAVSAYKAGEEVKAKKQAKAEETKEATREAMKHHSETISALNETFSYTFDSPALKINRFTDQALLERVMQRYQGCIVRTGKLIYAFDHATRVWRTQKDNREILDSYVHQCCLDTMQDPDFIEHECGLGDNAALRLKKAQDKWQSNAKISSCVARLLQQGSYPRMRISDFDKDNFKFYCKNGVLDLVSGELGEATAHDYLLRQSEVEFVEGATCPYFLGLLDEIFDENDNKEAMITFIQEMFGYTLTGSTDEQVMFIHHGEGSNGKSRILSVLSMLMGEYTALMQPAALAKKSNAIQNELNRIGAKIEGKRLVIIDDLDTKTQWNEGIVKNLTGDKIVARNLFEEEKDIPNRAKLHIGCNMLPEVEASNHAIHRRIVVIRYERQFEVNSAKMREIEENVRVELSGILNWAIDGLRRTLTRDKVGIEYPEEVRSSMEDYEEASALNTVDIGDLLRDLIEPSEEDQHSLTDVYKAMCVNSPAARSVSLTQLGIYLNKSMGLTSKRVRVGKKKVKYYSVRLKAKSLI